MTVFQPNKTVYDETIEDMSKDVPIKIKPLLVVSGVKHDNNKARYDLVPSEAIESIIDVLMFGASKYGDRNWESGITYGRCFSACMRHLWAWWRGEDNDLESGICHLAHAGANIFFLLAYFKRGMTQLDDRPTKTSMNK